MASTSWQNLEPLLTDPPCDHHLPCNSATVAWGYLDAKRPAQATIESGETISVDTVSMPNVGIQGLADAERCLPCEDDTLHTPPELFDIAQNVPKGEGPHVLTGPIAVRGAMPGDLLQIDVLQVVLRSNWGWTFSKPFGGALGTNAPVHVRYTALENKHGGGSCRMGRPAWGGSFPLAPFFGILGTAPPPELGRQGSIPPRNEFGGNLDCKELTTGSTVYLPVNAELALLYVGDGHGRQGDGECCGTALETSLTGAFRLTVIKPVVRRGDEKNNNGHHAGASDDRRFGVRGPLQQPRAETDATMITLACAVSADEASRLAIEDMLDWLGDVRPTLDRRDAYLMLSIAADVRITQLVNGNSRGCHVVLEKSVLPPPFFDLQEQRRRGSKRERDEDA